MYVLLISNMNCSIIVCTPGSSPADLHGMWYPTIRRTLVCLSRLYRCVEKSVFQGLAQEAIACCCENVNEAMKTISKNKVNSCKILFSKTSDSKHCDFHLF